MIPTALYPASSVEGWEQHRELLDEEGKFITTIGGYLIEMKDRKIVVNARHQVTLTEWAFWHGGDNPAGPHLGYVQKPLEGRIEMFTPLLDSSGLGASMNNVTVSIPQPAFQRAQALAKKRRQAPPGDFTPSKSAVCGKSQFARRNRTSDTSKTVFGCHSTGW